MTDVSYAVALDLSERRPGLEIPINIINFLHINPTEPKLQALAVIVGDQVKAQRLRERGCKVRPSLATGEHSFLFFDHV